MIHTLPSDQKTIQHRRQKLHKELRALTLEPLMRGSVVERVRKCGRKNCACAKDPDARHRGMFLTIHLDGKTQAVHLRPQDEEYVRRAIAQYEKLWTFINGLTTCELSDLKRKARERRRLRKLRQT